MAIGKEERFLNMELGKKSKFPILSTQFFTLPVKQQTWMTDTVQPRNSFRGRY